MTTTYARRIRDTIRNPFAELMFNEFDIGGVEGWDIEEAEDGTVWMVDNERERVMPLGRTLQVAYGKIKGICSGIVFNDILIKVGFEEEED